MRDHVIDSLGTDRYPDLDALIAAARDQSEEIRHAQ